MTVSGPIDRWQRLGLTCLTLLAVCLGACGTIGGGTVNNPPSTVGMPYDRAQTILNQ